MSSILNSNTVLEESQYSTVNEVAEHSIDILSDSDVESEDSSSVAYIKKKTFTIVDDNLFIADYSSLDEAPTWLKTLINTTATNKIYEANGSFLDSIQILINNLSNTYVPENEYTQAITNLNTQNANALFLINALDSTFQTELGKANAKIINIESTKASIGEVEARVLTVINAELNKDGSNLKTVIGNVSDAITTEAYTRGLQYNGIISSIGDLDDDITANTTATNALYTYAGLDKNGGLTGTGMMSSIQILQKQNDGMIEVVTGTYDVMTNVSEPGDVGNSNTSNDGLITSALPYANWIPKVGSGVPTGSDLQYRVYTNTIDNSKYIYTGIEWKLISESEFLEKEHMLRQLHVGDVYIMYSSSTEGYKTYVKSYKFIRTAVDETSPYATDDKGYTWSLVVDTDAQNAYIKALNAYDLADNKRRVFTETPAVPYDSGDLWVRVISGSNQIWKCTSSNTIAYSINDWSVASTDDSATISLSTGLANGTVQVKLSNAYVGDKLLTTYLNEEFDKTINVFSGTPEQRLAMLASEIDTNDIFIESATETGSSGVVIDVTNTYKYNGTSWVKINNNSNLTALADLADGKRTIFSNDTSMPVNPKTRDMWIPSNTYLTYIKGEIYLYNGTSWDIATKYTEDLDLFVSETYDPTIATLQNQVDGTIEYIYKNTASPMTEQYVLDNTLSLWNTQQLKEQHTGDVVYFKDTKHGYWYSHKDNVFHAISDTSILQALATAENAQAAADGIIVSYYAIEQNSFSSPYIDTNVYKFVFKDGVLYKYSTSGSWTAVSTLKLGDMLTTYVSSTKDIKNYFYNGTNWYTKTENGIVAESKAVTDLSTSLQGLGNTVNGDTSVVNSVNARISTKGAEIESKWAYNSSVTVNGTTYNSGFGIATSLTIGSGLPVGQSEFWIKADKFKLMSADGTKKSSYTPFVVDAGTGDITFNGKVAFTNVTGYTPPDVSGGISSNNDVLAQKLGYASYSDMVNAANNGQTIINGGYINTNLINANAITADQINTTGLIAENISATTINGVTLHGGLVDAGTINASVINKGSYFRDPTNGNIGMAVCIVTASTGGFSSGGGMAGAEGSPFCYIGTYHTSDYSVITVSNPTTFFINGTISGYGAGFATITLHLRVHLADGNIHQEYNIMARNFVLGGNVLWCFPFGGTVTAWMPYGGYASLVVYSSGFAGDVHNSYFSVAWSNM